MSSFVVRIEGILTGYEPQLPHNGRMKTHQTQRSDSLVKSSADHDFTNRSWSPPRVFANAETKIATVDSKMVQQNHSIVPDNGQSNTTVTKISLRATNRVNTMAHNNNTAIKTDQKQKHISQKIFRQI